MIYVWNSFGVGSDVKQTLREIKAHENKFKFHVMCKNENFEHKKVFSMFVIKTRTAYIVMKA